MRLAFVDLVFSWPPLGGAPADLYYTIQGLEALGHDVHLFFAACEENWDRGALDPDALPFPATRLDFPAGMFNPEHVPGTFRTAIDAWQPDVVFVCFGFFLKPYVTEALSHHKLVSRYYAYEPTCPRDFRVFDKNQTCPKNYLTSPNVCRRCALRYMGGEIRNHRANSYTQEMVDAGGYRPEYHDLLVRSLRCFDAVIVYNRIAKGHLEGFHSNVAVVPGGVHVSDFEFHPLSGKPKDGRAIILMTGRATDPSKGFKTLYKAAKLLAEKRDDFQVWVTFNNHEEDCDWFKAVGWHDYEGIMKLYQESDICVVPSLWEEPFGLVAVEAMATGRPACVARVGGLQEIVVHGETGYVYDRHDHQALAGHLGQLLDDPELRRRMGNAGRKRVEEEYDWKQVVSKHYPPLLEALAR